LAKIASLSFDPDPAPGLVQFTPKDVELWRDFKEYRNNRQEWAPWREEEWMAHHPPRVHDLFSRGFLFWKLPDCDFGYSGLRTPTTSSMF